MWSNDKTLREFDPPLAVEVLVYEVRVDAYQRWNDAEFEYWTLGEADRFPFYVGKETWWCPGEEWHTVTLVIYWESHEAWFSIDPGWLDEQERRFAEVVGADNYRLVRGGDVTERHYKISEYR
jgi:uncharacterized protein (TIGR03792 family)